MSLINCKGLSKLYGSKRALDSVDLQLEPGSPIALVGPNGAGKTTLMSLLLGYIRPSSGEITVMGQRPGSSELLGQISALPQDAALDPGFSLLTQFSLFARMQGMGAEAAKAESLRVLALVGLEDVANQKPNSLSHGMGKRAAIAQALIGNPKLVLLDEPTAGLDPANARKIRELVESLSADTTFIISSHNLDELEKLCDRVLYLDKGKLSQSVTMQQSSAEAYLTLQMQHCNQEKLLEALYALEGVYEVSAKGKQNYLIRYQPEKDTLDIELLQLLKQNGWQYRSLMRGRTLEDTLFDGAA